MPTMPLIKPDVPKVDEWAPLLDVSYRSNTFSNYGPLVRRLIDEVEKDMGDPGKKALPVANATVGLQVALQAINKPGAKVITQAFTFPATINAIFAAAMVPVFLDVQPDTWFVNPEVLDRELAARDDVAVVMIVRTLGMCGSITAIEEVCAKHDVALIVDSAGCFGGFEESGRKVGRAGIAEVFSFHATKPFSVGEGGLIYGDADFIALCKSATNFGLEGMTIVSHGTNAKMSEVSAAIALARRVGFYEDIVAPRNKRAQAYISRFAGSNHVTLPSAIGSPTWQFLPIRLPSSQHAERVVADLAEAGYAVRGYYRPALHLSDAYRGLERAGPMTVSERLAQEVVVLPLHTDVTLADIDRITQVVIASCAA